MKTRLLMIFTIGIIGFTSSTFAQDLPPCTSDRSACFEPTNCINTLWDCPDNSDIFSIVVESEPEPPTLVNQYGVELGYALLIVPPSILGILLIFVILRKKK